MAERRLIVGYVTGLAAEARIAGRLGPARAGGGTVAGARVAAMALLDAGAEALVSFGLAGGLDPALRPGDILVPRTVRSAAQSFDTAAAALGLGASHGVLVASAHIVATVAEKAALAATGAAAADMESGAVADIAAGRVPFAVLRAICDPAERSLSPAAMAGLDAAGGVAAGRVALAVLRRPGQLPALLRLASDAAAARAALIRRVDRLLLEGRGGLVRQL